MTLYNIWLLQVKCIALLFILILKNRSNRICFCIMKNRTGSNPGLNTLYQITRKKSYFIQISRCLAKDPARRPSPDEILSHSWFEDVTFSVSDRSGSINTLPNEVVITPAQVVQPSDIYYIYLDHTMAQKTTTTTTKYRHKSNHQVAP